jgi:hypothetical protein
MRPGPAQYRETDVRIIASAFSAAALSSVAAPALAQQSACAPREAIVSHLEKKYGETRRGVGLQNRGSVTEIYASAETGTWTIIVTRPDGVACAVAAGEAWLEEVATAVTPPA